MDQNSSSISLILVAILLAVNCPGQPGIITTIAGNHFPGSSGDGGPATNAQIKGSWGIGMDAIGNLYIADNGHNVRKVDLAGIITRIAGTDTPGYTGDGNPATDCRITGPMDVAVDVAGNVFIDDSYNSVIRKINAGGIISSYAGNGVNAYLGDGGSAVSGSLGNPNKITTDAAGNLYIADMFNKAVRKVNTAGTITTVAGNGIAGYTGDGGPATVATLARPLGVAVDKLGNIYVADGAAMVVRKINFAGIISTYAGNGTGGAAGDGGSATLAQLAIPSGIAVDAEGNLFIADRGNNKIRKVDAAGIITTVAGGDTSGYSGDGGPATNALLKGPTDVAVDEAGNLYIADNGNYVIRKVGSTLSASQLSKPETCSIYPNPSTGTLYIEGLRSEALAISIINTIGQTVYQANHDKTRENKQIALPETMTDGNYIIRIHSTSLTEHQSFTLLRQ
jgi:sugar lactone lactonase YvrE